MSASAAGVQAALDAVRARIEAAARRAGRDPSTVRLLAVSKTHGPDAVRAAYARGQRDFGENYVQEMIDKAERARADGLSEIRWHFIGHLQTNKVKALLPYVAMIHGVGSLRLAEEISKRAKAHETLKNGRISVLAEVNIDGEESKSGVQISELRDLATSMARLPNLEFKGLMCIPDPARASGSRWR